ncbi:MAG: M1 family aminopeptidase [Myxococcaceae bacterium]
MTFAQIARFELRFQLRQPLFWSVFALFFLLTFGAVTLEQINVGAGGNVLKNSPYAVAEIHLVWTLLFMFVTTAFVANVIVRDDETGFGPLIRTTPVRKFDYLYGRFTGAFAIVAACFLSVPLAVAAGSVMPWVDPETMGQVRVADLAYAYFVLALPGLLLTSTAFFALATTLRSMMATYLGVMGFFLAYIAMNVALSGPEHEALVSLLDPFGVAAFHNATRYWTAAERNTLLPALEGLLLYNRLLWLGVSLVLIALAGLLFRFEERPRKVRKQKPEENRAPARHSTRPLASPRFDVRTSIAQLFARTSFEARQVVRSPAFLVLLALGVANSGINLSSANELFGVDLHPVTREMVETLFGAFSLFPILVVTWYAGELVWRERDARINTIIDASAAPDWAFLVPKTIALALVLFAMLVVSTMTAMVVQAAQGYTNFELDKYLLWYLLPGAIDWALLAVLAVFLQAVSPSKPIGWGLMLLFLVSTIVLSNLGFEHGLYRYGAGPSVPLSDMNGTGDFVAAANWFRFYWSAFAVLLVVAGQLLWRRGTNAQLRERFAGAPRRLAGPAGVVAAVALLVAVGTGTWIFVNTNVWNDYTTSELEEQRLADMEKELLGFEKLPQPSIVDVKLELDLHPHEPRLVTTGSYVLENLTSDPLSEVHVRFDDNLEMEQLELEGARLEKIYDRFAYRIFRFDEPLRPGETRTLSFRTMLAQRGFKHQRNTERLVDNGTFVNNSEFAPQLGMSRDELLTDRTKRRKYGLPPDLLPASIDDERAHARNYVGADWVNADITVTTDADQTPIAPGYQVSDETRDGRRTARFVSEAPILHFFSVQSARYEVKRENHKGVELAVFHDPQHPYNVDRMIQAMRTSLDTFQEVFGPYQFRQARIIEFPGYSMFAQAFANTMPYSEGLGFIANFADPESIDYVTYVTAHEMAHQWWAHQIVGADVEGATALSETLAQYSALLVMERLYGPHQLRRFLKYELDAYLSDRASEPVEERPLLRVGNQPYIHYRKGSLVTYLLKDRLGEEAVNRALRGLLERHRFRGAPYPTSRALVEALRAEAGPEHQQLITDLFERITLFDLRAGSASVTPRDDGRFDVTLQVHARKLYADGQGVETEAPLAPGDTFDVGLFLAKPGSEGFDGEDVLHLQRVALKPGEQQVTLTVDKRPAFAGIDPYNKQIDRSSEDNLVAVSD